MARGRGGNTEGRVGLSSILGQAAALSSRRHLWSSSSNKMPPGGAHFHGLPPPPTARLPPSRPTLTSRVLPATASFSKLAPSSFPPPALAQGRFASVLQLVRSYFLPQDSSSKVSVKCFPAPGFQLIIPIPLLPSLACAVFYVSFENAAVSEDGQARGPVSLCSTSLATKRCFREGC